MPKIVCTAMSFQIPWNHGSDCSTSSIMPVSGIMTAWYGMNIPKRKSVNTVVAPGKRHREKTKPFIEPRIDESTAAQTARMSERTSEGMSRSIAVDQPSKEMRLGRAQASAGLTPPEGLKLVTMRTYIGMSTKIAKTMSST